MRIRQHVNPRDVFFETFRGEPPALDPARELEVEIGCADALDGVPAGLLGYEEHQAGSKGLHMNFVFVCEIAEGVDVKPNDEFGAWRWVNRAELDRLESPLNVRQFGYLALDARFA